MLYVSAETNVMCGGTEALFATRTTRSTGSYPSSSARLSVAPPKLIKWVICGGLACKGNAAAGRDGRMRIDICHRPSRLLRRGRKAAEEAGHPEADAALVG